MKSKEEGRARAGQKEPTGFLYFPFYIRPLFTTGLLSSSSAARSMIKFPSRAKREEWPQNKKRRKNPAAKYNSIGQRAVGSCVSFAPPPPLLFFDCIGPDHRETSHDFVLEPPTSSEYVCNMFTPTTSCPPH